MEKKSLVYTRIITSKYLPKFPENIIHILNLLQEPETDIDELAAAIEKDETLSSMILKNLNNNGFSIKKKIETVKDALLFWGLVSARNMIIFFITHSFYPKERLKKTNLFTEFKYWTHVLATGIAAEEIGKKVGYSDPFQLFTYGLIHDIGILAIDACLEEDEVKILNYIEEDVPQLEAESMVLDGLNHCDIGAWLCRREGFSKDIVSVVQYHHNPEEAPEYKDIARIIYLANIMGTKYVADSIPFEVDTTIDENIVKKLGLSDDDLAKIAKIIPETVSKFTQKPIGF